MFIKINSKEEALFEFKKYFKLIAKGILDGVTIHYNCSNCDDEQVTHSVEITDKMINDFSKSDCIYVSFPCTECGYPEKFLTPDNITGIEE